MASMPCAQPEMINIDFMSYHHEGTKITKGSPLDSLCCFVFFLSSWLMINGGDDEFCGTFKVVDVVGEGDG
jgi:hypothetical protein